LINLRDQTGFSYFWVLSLVALMAIASMAAIEIDATATRREREKELLAYGRQFRVAIARYYETLSATGQREYPLSLNDLLQDPRFPGTKRHLRKVFVDPMTAKPEWGLVQVGGRIVGVHSLSDQMPIKQDNFEPQDATFRHQNRYSQWVFAYPADLLLPSDAAASAGAPTSADALKKP
jgi:type II secretory pathway pseudopilin PulG